MWYFVVAVAQTDSEGNTVDVDDIKIQKKQGGSIRDNALVDGIVLDKERVRGMPKSVSGASMRPD